MCTSFSRLKKASLTVEATLVLPVFFFAVLTMMSFMDFYKLQTEHLISLCEKAKIGGITGYVFNGSGVENITIPDYYTYQPIGGMFPLSKIHKVIFVKVRTWTGKDHQAQQTEEQEIEAMVYVTETGKTYHTQLSCSYINLSVQQVSGTAILTKRNKSGQGYSACEICSKNQRPAGSVYITDSGNRYHNLGSCSGLKRTVKMIKESEATGYKRCSRCG